MSKNSDRLETALVKSFLQYLQMIGCIATRVNSGTKIIPGKERNYAFRGAPKGTSDIIGCYRGRYFAIEAKVAPNVASPEQLLFLEDVRAAGGLGIVAYNLEEVQDMLGILR